MLKDRGLWLAVLVNTAVFSFVASRRLIDADEGYYLLASKLVSHGAVPYRDFLYPQAPLLPYVYGAWMRLVGESWYAGRALSVVAAVLLGALLYRHARWLGGSATVTALATVLFAFSSLSFGWLTTVKAYALSTLCLFGAYVVVAQASRDARLARYVFGGVLLGLALDTRLMLAATLPAFIVWLATTGTTLRRGATTSVAFAGGTAIAWIVVNAPFLLLDADRFWFNNLWFHGFRSSIQLGLFGNLEKKLLVLVELFDVRGPGAAGGVQSVILLALTLWALVTRAVTRAPLAFGIALCVAAVSLLPNPPFPQYFVVVVPFMLAATVPALMRPLASPWMIWAVSGLYLLGAPLEAHRYLVSGEKVQGVQFREAAINWQVATVERVTAELAARTRPTDVVFVWWPGYLVGVDRPYVPRTGTHFGLYVSERLSPSERDRYRIPSHPEIVAQIRAGAVRAAVVGDWVYLRAYRELLRAHGYVPVLTIGRTELYVAPDASTGR